MAILTAAFMLLSLAACSKTEDEAEQGQDRLPDRLEVQTGTSKGDPQPEDKAPETEEVPVPVEAQLLDLKKQKVGLYEWSDTALLARSEYSYVTFWNGAEDTALDKLLTQRAAMIERSMTDEYDNLVSMAHEDPSSDSSDFDTNIFTLDEQVRRADSVVVSLLSDSYANYGQIRDFRAMHGTNYDTQTGKELKISDVVKDLDAVAPIVEQELNSHMWAGDFSYDGVISDYFKNTPEDGISWTLDYNGVTFYFSDGTLTEPGYGRLTATVTFAGHSELFEEKYRTAPATYIVELPMDSSFFTDLDDNGDLEELNITAWFDSDVGMYASYGIYTDTDGHYNYEECYADGFEPYYVRAAGGRHYIYLFCKQMEGYGTTYMLKVYDVADGKLDYVGEMYAGPGCVPADIFRMPIDPDCFYLDAYDSMAQDMMPYLVGPDGMPELIEETNVPFNPEQMIERPCEEERLADTFWFGHLQVDPQSGESIALREEETVLAFYADGTGFWQHDGQKQDIKWRCESDGTAAITMQNGVNYYLSMQEDSSPESGMYWLMLMLEKSLIWLY